MIDTSAYYEKNDILKKRIMTKSGFEEAMRLALELHAACHLSEISGIDGVTYEDAVWDRLGEADFRKLPQQGKFSIALHLWHITRIEDLVGNILIRDAAQVYNNAWHKKLGNTIIDTGNAMTDDAIRAFSNTLDMSAFREYRIAVGKQTRDTIASFKVDDMKRKPSSESLKRLMKEGGLMEDKGSFWLLDFWGKKSVKGLVVLPLTRHHMMHIEDCLKIREALA